MTLGKLKLSAVLFFSITFFPLNTTAQLKSPGNSADYLIITPSQFIEGLQPFIEWRGDKGYNIKTVDLDEIYSEFQDTTQSSSIRNFISYALTYWNDPKPQYFLLVGGEELLPSCKVKSNFADYESMNEDSVLIDEWYVVNKYDSTYLPEAALGRAPVYSGEELNNFISKTIFFEDSLSFSDYENNFTIVTDRADSLSFTRAAESFAEDMEGYGYSAERLFGGEDSTIDITKGNLIDKINSGTFFLTYFGHGAARKWSQYDLFTLDDVDSLSQNGLPFILTTAACSQSFYAPGDSSLIRKLFVAENKGTVASVAATGLGYLQEETDFLNDLFNNLLSDSTVTVGDAMLKAKLTNEIGSPSSFQQTRLYTLLGDPALDLPLEIITGIPGSDSQIPSAYVLNQNYPNPFNPSTTITFSLPEKDNISLIVYDILGREITRLADGTYSAGEHTLQFNASSLSSGVYLYCLQTSASILTKKMMLLK